MKRGDQPSMGGQVKWRVAPKMLLRRAGAGCGGASAPSSMRQGPGRRALVSPIGAMRIRTGSASSTTDLAGYLRRCECILEFLDEWTLEVGVRPGSLSEQHARIELEGYLQVWEVMNPDVSVDRLTPRPSRS